MALNPMVFTEKVVCSFHRSLWCFITSEPVVDSGEEG